MPPLIPSFVGIGLPVLFLCQIFRVFLIYEIVSKLLIHFVV